MCADEKTFAFFNDDMAILEVDAVFSDCFYFPSL